ncbi:PigN-domain-containing protein [Microthyrium microscopicum]|uniref:GPI ethanolamine phosphate transferase 1 n=1 Tax=Microthyrium microscopicum TaxID=703497 RepID=A0A6A6TXX7_9PEZI|nr:PigN-domain-containing protein [Microthyrium microscopicum]
MARLGRNGFLAIAVIFHLIYVYSVFDTYFTSPIVHGMREYEIPDEPAPAKRLILFVGDGLRADKAFQSFPDPSPSDPNDPESKIPRHLMPFLRSKILKEGTFGVSHTRVPTESRPGHVALIAGLYEDVSAVTTGWKHNPVDFDSVFNKSRHTWSWGSPDILPMFKDGAVDGRIDVDMYGHEAEDFSTDAVELDLWVFDKVKAFFAEAKKNETLGDQLRQDKLVFFLHLLGLDTTGHSYRPYSKEYLHNIKVVDQGVKEIVALMEDFYNDDGQTAYVFTADHGMSDWGSHGDGHPDNTRTPLITWGSGVAKPVTKFLGKAPGHEDCFSADWDLDSVQRHDVSQADVAALMAYLAGLPFPVNSVGELPLSYLSASPKVKAKAILTNAREILEMYLVKEEQKRSASIRFKPYPEFIGAEHTIPARLAAIENAIDRGRTKEATADCASLIKLGLEGLRYLQTYNWLFLRTVVTAGYLGWMAFGLTAIIDIHVLHGSVPPRRSTASNIFFSSTLILLFSYLLAEHSPITYYFYVIFPVFFWEETFAMRNTLIKGKEVLFNKFSSKADRSSLLFQALAFMGLLQALVWSYSNRTIYSICYAIAVVWPVFYGSDFLRKNFLVASTWAVASLSMSAFTLLPANKVENLSMVMAGGVLMVLVGVLYLVLEDSILGHSVSKGTLSRCVIGLQIGLVMLSMVSTYSAATSLQAKQGLPLGTQIVGWLTMIASLGVPFLHTLDPINHYLHRLLILFLAFAPSFVILTISYEGLFYIAFSLTLLTWVRLEHLIYRHVAALSPPVAQANGAMASPAHRPLTLADVRPSLFTLYLLQSAFFSTGNIASISSFSLDAVYRLIPVFDPFSQGALLIFKILVPFAVLSAAMGMLNQRLGFAPGALFMGLIVAGDWLTLNFFWMVRDEGSWLEIGETISRFCIVSALCVFAAGLEVASSWLVGGLEVEPASGEKKTVAFREGADFIDQKK